MQQTLIAMAALLTATLLSFSQQQTQIQKREQIIRAEMRQIALGVAKQTLEVVRAQQFDGNIDPEDPDVDEIPDAFASPSDAFGSQGACGSLLEGELASACEAIEDFHGESGTVPFQLPDGEQLLFEVQVEVYYVCPDFSRSDDPQDCDPSGQLQTRRKEVIVKVRDQPNRGEPRLTDWVTISEVLAFS